MRKNHNYNAIWDKELVVNSEGNSTSTPNESGPGRSVSCGVIRIPFRDVASATVCLPLAGFIFCVIWSMYLDKEAATYTHCGVRNYLPSVSAAMSKFTLSRTVWRVCIALHATPRFGVIAMYSRYLESILFQKYVLIAKLTSLCNVLENLGLIGLTYVSSTENYSVHEKCFIVFMVFSTLYMLMLCQLLKKHRNIPPSFIETKSLRAKWILVTTNLTCVVLACYVFVRHNKYCEEGMYTIFALLEYFVILTNMGFHLTAYWDFYDRVLTIGKTWNFNNMSCIVVLRLTTCALAIWALLLLFIPTYLKRIISNYRVSQLRTYPTLHT